uniref:Transporter n=1 Tax=Gongylonema pulchrum TaxID=637853 RepID=A0A183F032_9BILA
LEPENALKNTTISESNAKVNGSSTVQSTTVTPMPAIQNGKPSAGFMLAGGVMSHKESIFLKLNKRISNLELHMSLSSEYLSELSRRYVLQTTESRRQAELIIKQAEEAAVKAVKPIVDALKIQVIYF